MKKWILVGAIVLIFTAFAVYQHVQGNKPTQISSSGSDYSTSTISSNALATGTVPTVAGSGVPGNSTAAIASQTTPAQTATSTPTTTPTPTPAPVAQSGQYKNGSYTGPVVDVFYGNIQVAATISGGQLTAVNFLQYPNDRGNSQRINSQAMPMLKTEAIQAQSANVDIVSSATLTSQAFITSLGQALSQARN
jgi:uncharacterized protein with FMN-binding domain